MILTFRSGFWQFLIYVHHLCISKKINILMSLNKPIILNIETFEMDVEERTSPLIQGLDLTKNDLFITMPLPFRALFESEASTKYIIFDAIQDFKSSLESDVTERRIDISSRVREDVIGIECKPKIDNLNLQQMGHYENAGLFDYLYLAFPVTANNEGGITTAYTKSTGLPGTRQEAFARAAFENYGKHYGKDCRGMPNIANAMQSNLNRKYEEIRQINNIDANVLINMSFGKNYGIVAYNPFGKSIIVSKPTHTNKSITRDFTRFGTPEEFVKYYVWKYFRNQGYTIAAEAPLDYASHSEDSITFYGVAATEEYADLYQYMGGELRKNVRANHRNSKSGHYRIDFVARMLSKTDSNNEELIGIECKKKAFDARDPKVAEQLLSYLNSGQLSRLYLAIHENSIEETQQYLLEANPELEEFLGILSVSNSGDVLIRREAHKIPVTKSDTITITKVQPRHGAFARLGAIPSYRQ